MLYVHEVAAYFRDLIDSPDPTVMTVARVARMLKVAESEFRGIVNAAAPDTFSAAVTLTLSNQSSIDLASGSWSVLGPSAANARLVRILDVQQEFSGGNYRRSWGQAQSRNELNNGESLYLLEGTTLLFPGAITATFRLVYFPVSEVDWTKQATGDDEFIDDLTEWHDVIALLAVKQYQPLDGALNNPAMLQLQQRIDALKIDLNRRGASRSPFVGGDTSLGGWYP